MRVFLIDFENVHSEGMAGVDHLTEHDEVIIFYSNNADSITFDALHKLILCKSKLNYYKIKRGGKNALDFQLSCYLGFRISRDPEAEFYIISKDNGYDFIMDFWECGYLGAQPNIRRFNSIRTLLQWTTAQKTGAQKAAKTLKALADNKTAEIIPDVKEETPEPETKPIIAKPAVIKPKTTGAGVLKPIKPVKTSVSDLPKPEDVSETVLIPPPPLPFVPSQEQAAAAAELMSSAKTSHELYLSMVKRFGQKKGREVYAYYKAEFLKTI